MKVAGRSQVGWAPPTSNDGRPVPVVGTAHPTKLCWQRAGDCMEETPRRRRSRRNSDQKKRRRSADAADEPLGKLIHEYGVNLASALVACGFLTLMGLAAIGYALMQRPLSLIILLIGAVVVLAAFVVLVTNIINVGRRLELRKRGVRFVESGVTTEIYWSDVADIIVDRADRTNVGIATVHTRSDDAVSPSGLLTNTDWTLTIQGHDGNVIRLRPVFLKTVRNVQNLISQLRLGAGLP